jgi:8-oxo-dGTP pyrophosphatase MutT (NUDIX family)
MPSQRIIPMLRKLSNEEPKPGPVRFASVAVIVLDGDDPMTLMIKRAERKEDPWSGQVAFPGGKRQDIDVSIRDTAIRETKEELGIDLSESAKFVGYYGPFRTHTGTMDVVPSVFLLEKNITPAPNEEVSSFRWVAFSNFADPLAKSAHTVRRDGATLEMPALLVDDYVVWGLTYRMISSLILEET